MQTIYYYRLCILTKIPVFQSSWPRMPVFLAPMSPFTIVLLHGNISKISMLIPWHIIWIFDQHMACNSPSTGQKIGKAYCQAFLPCLQLNWPVVYAS